MAQTKLNATTQQGKNSEVERARDALNTTITAIGTAFGKLKSQDLPAQVDTTNKLVRYDQNGLLYGLVHLNEALKQYNNGNDVIPVTGSNDDERLHSLNRWLSISPADSPITEATITALNRSLVEAYGSASQDNSATILLGQMRGTSQGTVQPSTSNAAIVVPVPVETFADEAAPTISSLRYIAQNGPKKSVRDKAKAYAAALDKAAKAPKPPKGSDKKLTEAKAFVEQNIDPAEAMALARGPQQAGVSLEKAAAGSRADQVLQIASSLDGHPEKLAHDVKQMLPDLWLLGDEPMNRTLVLLKRSADALVSGDANTAQKRFDEALVMFNNEQTLMRTFTEKYVVPVADSAVSTIVASHFPTGSELAKMERKDKVKHGEYYQVSGRHHNGKEDLLAAAKARQQGAAEILTPGRKISFYRLSTLYDATVSDERTLKTLNDMMEYARTNGLSALDSPDRLADRVSFYQAYSRAAMTLVDAKYNPYNSLSKEQRRGIVMMHLGITDESQLTAKEAADAEKAIIPQLIQSKSYVHDDMIFGFYIEVQKLTPESRDPALASIATLRSLRPVAELDYMKYQSGMVWNSSTGNYETLSTEQLQSQERLATARDFLVATVAKVKETGTKAEDPMVKSAEAWLKVSDSGKVSAERVPVVSDTLYEMAVALSSIREAELWAASPQLRSSTFTPARLEEARGQIALARKIYTWNFSGANEKAELQVDPAFHVNEATAFADRATVMLAPKALAATEAPAMFAILTAYKNPSLEVDVADSEHPTQDERGKAAAAAEKRHLAMDVSLRDNASFAVSGIEVQLRDNKQFGAFTALDPRVGRLGNLEPKLARKRISGGAVDAHYVPNINKADPNVAALPHEDLNMYSWGQLLIEANRMALLPKDDGTPQILKGLNTAPKDFKDPAQRAQMMGIATRLGIPTNKPFADSMVARVTDASMGYATRAADAQQADLNSIALGFLDARIAELEAHLKGSVIIGDKRNETIAKLERYQDPRAAYVRNARAALAEAKKLRARLAADPRGDWMSNAATPRHAIALTEVATASLDPNHFSGVPRETIVVKGNVSIPSDAIDTTKQDSYSPVRLKFTLKRVMVTPETGTPIPFEEFAKANPSNLTLFWVVYQALGRTDQKGEKIQYVYNPNFKAETSPPEDRYVGVIVRGVKTSTGESGDYAVKVRWTKASPSTDPQWIPVMLDPNTIDMSQVLYRVKSGTVGEPVNDALFQSRISDAQNSKGPEFFFETDYSHANSIWVNQYAPSIPYVIGTLTPAVDQTAKAALKK